MFTRQCRTQRKRRNSISKTLYELYQIFFTRIPTFFLVYQTTMTRTDQPHHRHLLVFDINHIFVKKGTESVRPYAKEFWTELLNDTDNYAVAIWASSQSTKVDCLLNKILTENQRQQLLFVWDHAQCKQLSDFQITRDLSHIWQQFPEFNAATTTIFVNDAKKVMDEYAECVGLIPSYEGPRKAKGDQVLLSFKDQIDTLVR